MPFLKVARVQDFDADRRSLDVKVVGRSVRLVRRDDGSFEALEMVCRHQNADLSGEDWNRPVVVCSRHGWRYDTASGECLTESWARLRRFPVEVDGDAIRVSTQAEEEAAADSDIPDLGEWA